MPLIASNIRPVNIRVVALDLPTSWLMAAKADSHDEGAGRGMCEGWSLEIGVAFRGSVVRQDRTNQPTTWLAAVNAGYLGELLRSLGGDGAGRGDNRAPHENRAGGLGSVESAPDGVMPPGSSYGASFGHC